MARIGLRMMPTFPSSPLKFRTVGFPQYGFKASMSDRACRNRPFVKPLPGIRSSWSRWHRSFVRVPDRVLPGSESRTAGHSAYRRARGVRPATPGVLGSGPSSVVSARHRLLRPHPPVSRARSAFAAWPLIHRAFAVRARLGDPRDLPYFCCCTFPACHRPYAGGSAPLTRCCTGARCQASPSLERVATREVPSLPAILDGSQISALHRSRYATARAFACPPDWLRPDGVTCAPPGLRGTLALPLLTWCVAAPRWEPG